MFKIALSLNELQEYVLRQLDHFFPDNQLVVRDKRFNQAFLNALDRTEYCFRHVKMQSYHHEGNTFFSHLHSDQYTLFLWFLSNSLWKEYEDAAFASKIFYLNKALNGVMCMYDADMPDIFLVLHGGGVVLGKASYSNFFVCYQGCTVGAIDGAYPHLGKGVVMAPQSTIIGSCVVEGHSTIGNQALLRNMNLKSGMLYYRDIETGQHLIRESDKVWAQSFFNVSIPHDGERI